MGKRSVRTVLLVDDFDVQLNTWARDFRREGKRVLRATNQKEALREARRGQPDVAIVDLFLGPENGLDVAQDLKARDPNVFVVLVSANMSVAYAMAAVRAGADDVFVKPIRCKQLVKRVEEGVPLEADVDAPTKLTLAQIEWEHISRAMLDCGKNITHAAEHLGIYRQSLQRKLRKRGNSI
jgi:two-component system response regulator RegA